MNNYIGRKLDGRYEIKELIGSGGMADIYKAYDSIEEKIVAVKILKEEFANDDDFLRRFRNESKAITLLSHPNIVKIFDVGFTEKLQFIVMEFIDGITLTEYIEREGVIKWKDAVHFTLQILRALQHAHDKGIVHRDVKPQNVMLLQDGTIKLMDFGIARFARENGRTLSDKTIGSVHYISPEQARGEHIDERSDVYSVGVMLYEMLTGRKPYDGDTPVAVALMHMQSDFTVPSEINPDIPKGLEEIVIRAMQREMDRRYQSASEMIKDIDEFKNDSSIVFEYKYMTNDDTTKYFDKVTETPKPKKAEKAVKIIDEEEEDEEEEDDDKPSPFIPILAAVASAFVIIAVIVIVVMIVSSLNNNSTEIVMPNITGMTIQEVEDKYPDLKLEENEPQYSLEYEKGEIIKQEPVKDSKIKSNRIIKVTLSKGKEMLEVEDVVGKQYKVAKKVLEKQGFVIQTQYESNEVAADYVIKTDPEAGSSFAQGDTITVYVSLGPAELNAIMPDIVGKSKSAAQAALNEEKINAVFEEVDSATVKEGYVVSQYPKANAVVDSETNVVIQISSGKAPQSDVSVSVSVPKGYTGDYVFSAYVDGEKIKESTLSVEDTESWKVDVKGTGTATLTIKVLNAKGVNETYAVYSLDFDKVTSKLSGSVNEDVFLKGTVEENTDGEETTDKDESKPSTPTDSKPSISR